MRFIVIVLVCLVVWVIGEPVDIVALGNASFNVDRQIVDDTLGISSEIYRLYYNHQDSLIWSAKVYLSQFEVPVKSPGNPTFPTLQLVLGILSGVIFLSVIIFYARKYSKIQSQIVDRNSAASAILGDDESYTIHSESTLSSLNSNYYN
jgi:hypothetical protein